MRTGSLAALAPTPRLDRAALGAVVLLTCSVVVGGAGCPRGAGSQPSTLPVVTTDDPEAKADLEQAREAFEAGRGQEAKRRFRRFLQAHPDDPLVPMAKLDLGRTLLAEGKTERARSLFEEVAAHSDPAVAQEGRFYVGVAAHRAGEPRQALDVLRGFVGKTDDPDKTALLLQTIAAASLDADDPVGAVEAFDRLARATAPEQAKTHARQRLETLVRDTLDADEIQTLFDRLPRDGAAWPLVARRALRESSEAGNTARVRTIAQAIEEHGVTLDEDLRSMAERAERPDEVQPSTIGAVLPLSGRARQVGQRTLRGILLGAGSPRQPPTGEEAPQVLFRDDAGSPERAVQAVDELVSAHGVIGIVGPVEGKGAKAAATRAQEMGVPLIGLSPVEGLTAIGPMVFRQFFTRHGEARELVAAARARDAQRFAVLHPESGFGRAIADAFAGQVETQGGTLVSTVTYAPDETSFAKPIAQLAKKAFDCVIVADSADRLELIAPALAAAGLWSRPPDEEPPEGAHAITLVAPTVGYSPSLLDDAARYLQGALFARPFHPDGATGAGKEFRTRYEARYGSTPGTYAAYAYDAVRLIRRAVKDGAATRTGLAEHLAGMRDVDTAGSSRGFARTREPARGPRIYEVHGDALEPVHVPTPSRQTRALPGNPGELPEVGPDARPQLSNR